MNIFLPSQKHTEGYASTLRLDYNPLFDQQVELFFRDLYDGFPQWHRLLEVDKQENAHTIREKRHGDTIFSLLVSPDGVRVRGWEPGIRFDDWRDRAKTVHRIALERFVGEFPQKISHLDIQFTIFFDDQDSVLLPGFLDKASSMLSWFEASASMKNFEALLEFPKERRLRLQVGLSESDNTAIMASYGQLYSKPLQGLFTGDLLDELIEEGKPLVEQVLQALLSKD